MLKEDLLKLNLQFFADGDNPDDDPKPEDGGQNPDDDPNKQKDKETFTKSDVDSEVSKAIEAFKQNQEPKQKQQIDDAVKAALDEQKRLSKLSQKERQEEELTQREKDIQEREQKIKRAELKSDAVADLQKKGLPSDFADFLIDKDAESTLANIKTFKEAFDSAVNDGVKEKLRQDTPPAGNAGGGSLKADNLGKKLAASSKQNNADLQKAQDHYFKTGGNQ